ncbi:MAG: c-type cytochrome [Verrucomicrobia bacterium]|nr:c-type cytochrome [Verrucomicrobiota bacterium]
MILRACLGLAAIAVTAAAADPKRKAAGQTPGQAARAAVSTIAAPTDPAALQVPPGFKVELLYTVPKEEEGSWVALAVDPKGRITAGDQYGGLYRITVPPIGTSTGAKVEKLAITVPDVTPPPGTESRPTPKRAQATDGSASPSVGAHGLLYAFGSLYVMIGEVPAKHGLWRFRDTDGDDQFDEFTYLREMRGGGEHGPHGLALSPDGKSIYFANGNYSDLPARLDLSRPVRWDEDHLLPRMWDARGHAKNRYAPGGYVGRTDPDGRVIELFAIGFRNHYDLAFDQNGELFTYDSDMEWDQGTPWYMPTRINHVIGGGDYGWRSGAGRWPDYYADSLPATLNLGPGSPTGTVFGTGAKFPAKYQLALYAADWTYGTLYAVHHQPDGATYRGVREEFVAGKPLPLTDLVINPLDGALYFAVGGRRTQAALYRVTYTGNESTAPAKPAPLAPEVMLRRSLEELHAEGTGPVAIATLWPHLGHPDRFVRFAARAALERQLPEIWADRALNEKNPRASIEALIALARVGRKHYQPRLLDALGRLDLAQQPADLVLPLLRAWQLAFTRMGKPDVATCARLAAKFDPLFPHADAFVNRELVSLLIFLDSPTVVAKTVPLLSVSEPPTATFEQIGGAQLTARNDNYGKVVNSVGANRPDRQQIAYAYNLRHATTGWTPKLRVEFFSWFARTAPWRGGSSFSGFIQNIRTESLALVADPAERAALDALSKPVAAALAAGAISPQGPGRNYTVTEATALAQGHLTGRDFARGKGLYIGTACIVCHRFNQDGSGIGPDLTGAGNRYTVKDLLENIIEPSKVISDQYDSQQFDLADGTTLVGRVVGEENGELLLMSNPFMPDEKTRVKAAAVKSRKTYPVSMMPPGLINSLNPEELKDLLAYLLSGGNPDDKMFKR